MEPINLRKLTSADIEAFYVWASNPEVAKTMTWEAYTSKAEAETFLKQVAENHAWFMAICIENHPVGAITLAQGKGASQHKAELGYVLAKEFWGKGITTQAVKLALEKGFKELGVQRIEALVDPDNLASQMVLVKAGMHYEGLLKKYTSFKGEIRDRLIYSKCISEDRTSFLQKACDN